MQAAEVPMAVASSCSKYIPPNSKMLLHITRAITSLTISKGNPSERVRLSSHTLMTLMAWFASMLVCIDVVSAVNNHELGYIFSNEPGFS